MNWRIFEHFLVLALALGAGVIAYLWRTERKEWAALDEEEDAALAEGLAARARAMADMTAERDQLQADLDACRDQHVTKAATGPLTAVDPYPKARERFKPKPQ